jgi:holo-[acyl-carrier-protein] synthase
VIVGIGTDVCSIERIRRSLDRFGERLVKRILTPDERPRFARVKDKAGHLAKRFAAKEAFSKAIGTGIHAPFTWHSITVTRNPRGKPGHRTQSRDGRTPEEDGRHRGAPLAHRRWRRRHGVRRAGRQGLMRLGPVMVDVGGLELTPDDVERLQHPQVGGVILFARNFAAPLQLIQLTHSIRELRTPALVIAVDHEGGRVQRFRHGFTPIPAMRELGKLFDRDPAQGIAAARGCGFVMGSELQAHGVDFSFAPVLDVDYGESGVIGDRALHADPNVIAVLAEALQAGLNASGMMSVGKHFPAMATCGPIRTTKFPSTTARSPRSPRATSCPFQRLARSGMGGIMPRT